MLPKELIQLKELGKQITILTAWDSISSAIVQEAGADVVLVGDSLSMVILGHETTLPVTLEQMLHHTLMGLLFLYRQLQQTRLRLTSILQLVLLLL